MSRLTHRAWLAAVALAAALAVAPGTVSADPSPRIYTIVIDGLLGSKVDQGKAPFISSLLAGQGANATYFPSSRSVFPAETNPNHTAMLSGADSGSSGVAGNGFGIYAPLESDEDCTTTGPFDFASLPSLTSGEDRGCSQAELSPTAIKRQGNPRDQVSAVVMGKPKLGKIFSTRRIDPDAFDADYLWAPCDSGDDDDDAYCEQVPTNPVTGYAIDDRTVMDEVIETIRRGVPVAGETRRPDFTFVNLPQVDSAGHATGTGPVYDTVIAQADDEIERLVGELKQRGEWERSVLIVVSDHGMDETPEKVSLTAALTDAGIPEDRFAIQQNGSVDMLYLADRTDPGRFDLLSRMREVITGTGGVAEALYREPNPTDGGTANTVSGVHPDWGSDGERNGDLFITSVDGAAFSDPSSTSNPLPGNHGAPQTAGNFLAVFGGGPLVRQGTAGEDGEPTNADLASTTMGLLGLFPTENNEGNFLADAFSDSRLRQVARPIRPPLKIRKAGKGRGKGAIRLPRLKPRDRKTIYRLDWAPEGGSFDLEARRRFGAVRKRGRWESLLRGTEQTSVLVRGRKGQRYNFRIRARSAADIPGRWRLKAPKLR